MTEEKKAQKLAYLRSQKENPTGNYRKYLVNIYNYILEDSQANGTGWSKAYTKDMLNYVYDGQPDHMGYELVDQWKKELRDLGYIKFVKEENEWRTYIAKELDF